MKTIDEILNDKTVPQDMKNAVSGLNRESESARQELDALIDVTRLAGENAVSRTETLMSARLSPNTWESRSGTTV